MKLNYLLHSHDKKKPKCETYLCVRKQKQNKEKHNMIARHTLQWNELAVSQRWKPYNN